MAKMVRWGCDGCGKTVEKPVSQSPDDWSVVTVTMAGFRGYPVGDLGNGQAAYDLCSACQRTIVERANPRRWPRSKPEGSK